MKVTIINKSASMRYWKAKENTNYVWYINDSEQFTYIQTVQVWHDCIEVYVESNGTIPLKIKLSSEDTVKILEGNLMVDPRVSKYNDLLIDIRNLVDDFDDGINSVRELGSDADILTGVGFSDKIAIEMSSEISKAYKKGEL